MTSALEWHKASTKSESSRIITTLFDIVRAVNEVTEDDKVVLVVVPQLVNRNHARLRDARLVIG